MTAANHYHIKSRRVIHNTPLLLAVKNTKPGFSLEKPGLQAEFNSAFTEGLRH